MAFKDYLVGAIFAGLFAILFIAWAVQTSYDNNNPQNIINDANISSVYKSLNSSFGNTSDLAASQLNLSTSDNPIVAYGTLVLYTMVTIPQKFTSISIGIYNLIISFLTVELGIPPIILIVATILIIIGIIFGLFRVWRLGY